MMLCSTMAAVFGQKVLRRPGPLTIRNARTAEAEPAGEEEARLPTPKPAVMNVDVQTALSKLDLKSFAEAKAAEAKKVVDGEPLWLYVKFKTRLGDYVVTTRNPDDPEKLRYTLYAEIGPRGDITALNQYSIEFSKDDLAATEVKINLAPGMFGRNKSIPVFLMTSASSRSGVWHNEFRLTNTVLIPRGLTDNLATSPVTLEFPGGVTKYKKMGADYDSITLRGTTDTARMPVAGTFYSETLSDLVTTKLASENIRRQKIYFSGDDWQEFASSGPPMTKTRRLFATFTYQRDGSCFYGVAEVTQTFEPLEAKYGEPGIKLQKDIPIPCTEL
jgi:hypothetical protein